MPVEPYAQQAQARAARLRAEGHTFDAVVVSPLSRAIQVSFELTLILTTTQPQP